MAAHRTATYSGEPNNQEDLGKACKKGWVFSVCQNTSKKVFSNRKPTQEIPHDGFTTLLCGDITIHQLQRVAGHARNPPSLLSCNRCLHSYGRTTAHVALAVRCRDPSMKIATLLQTIPILRSDLRKGSCICVHITLAGSEQTFISWNVTNSNLFNVPMWHLLMEFCKQVCFASNQSKAEMLKSKSKLCVCVHVVFCVRHAELNGVPFARRTQMFPGWSQKCIQFKC